MTAFCEATLAMEPESIWKDFLAARHQQFSKPSVLGIGLRKVVPVEGLSIFQRISKDLQRCPKISKDFQIFNSMLNMGDPQIRHFWNVKNDVLGFLIQQITHGPAGRNWLEDHGGAGHLVGSTKNP